MHFLNVYHCFESVGRLTRALSGSVPQASCITTAYRQAITGIRPIAPPAAGISISFECGPWGSYLLEHCIFEDIFVGIKESDRLSRAAWSAQVAEALQYIRELHPDLGRIVDLLVTDVVVLSSERTGGGSASHIAGLVCISPGPGWTMVDFAESIVHEATHLNLFVADMVYGMYRLPASELAADEYRVLSAVKVGELRPLDKAFHSAVVAVPLMYMQYLRGESTLVDQFTTSLLECCEGLVEKRACFTDYGMMLVEELQRFALTTDFNYVVESLSSPAYAFCSLTSEVG
ncbi:MAG: aKG-HExxH-type peptide beta-hydroxylase [Pseudonocardia sp.]